MAKKRSRQSHEAAAAAVRQQWQRDNQLANGRGGVQEANRRGGVQEANGRGGGSGQEAAERREDERRRRRDVRRRDNQPEAPA
jgi:hypothetical protein